MQQFNSTLVLSSSFDNPIISDKIIREVSLLTFASPKILWPKISIEFSLKKQKLKLNLLDKLRKFLKKYKIDVNIVRYNKSCPRQKKLLVADMDSTLIQSESLDDLAKFYGMQNKIQQITSDAMNGKIDYQSSLKKRVELLKGLSSKHIETIKQNIHYNKGAKKLVSTMKNNGAKCALATGGFYNIANKVKNDLNMDFIQANKIEIINKKFTGKLIEPILDHNSKLKFLEKLSKELNISIQCTCSIGDGANDIEIIKSSEMGVAFKGKEKLKKNTDFILDYSDLTGLLFLQGYTKKQIEIN